MHNFLQDILKESNTIIIPGLGALTVTSTKTGDIYFMPFLKHDDGHLAKYVSTHEGVELSEAKQILSNFVEAIKTAIAEGDYFEMEEFGRFFTNKEGEIDFERWEDYQVKDNSILSKKIQEREKAQPKKVEKPIVLTKKEEPKVEPVVEPLVETIITPIIEPTIEPIVEESITPINETSTIEEPITHQPVIEQKSIDEVLGDSVEEQIPPISSIITPIEEHIHTPTVEEIIEAPERDILTDTDPTITEEVVNNETVITENKKELRKKLKSEQATAKKEEKNRLKAAKLEAKASKKTEKTSEAAPKEKKKSKSILIWLFSSVAVTAGIMWYIKTQREGEVHLTVIDKKESKVVTSKVVEKEDLHKEIAKHKGEKGETKVKEAKEAKGVTSNEVKEVMDVKEKPEVKKAPKVEVKAKPAPKMEVKEKPVTKPAPKVEVNEKPTVATKTPVVTKEVKPAPVVKPTPATPVAKGTTATPAAKPTTTATAPAVKGTTVTPAAKPTTAATAPAVKGTTATPAAKPTTAATAPAVKGTPATPTAKPTATTKPATGNSTAGYVSPNKNIQVIVGTFKDKASADQFVGDLKGQGFSTAYSKEDNGQFSVSLGSFSTLSESSKALQKYKSGKK